MTSQIISHQSIVPSFRFSFIFSQRNFINLVIHVFILVTSGYVCYFLLKRGWFSYVYLFQPFYPISDENNSARLLARANLSSSSLKIKLSHWRRIYVMGLIWIFGPMNEWAKTAETPESTQGKIIIQWKQDLTYETYETRVDDKLWYLPFIRYAPKTMEI